MGRPVYPYELDDPDFSWLVSKFREEHPEYLLVETSSLPLIMIESRQCRIEVEAEPVDATHKKAEVLPAETKRGGAANKRQP